MRDSEGFEQARDKLLKILAEALEDEEDSFPHDLLWLMEKYKDRKDLRTFIGGLCFMLGAETAGYIDDLVGAMAVVVTKYELSYLSQFLSGEDDYGFLS